MFNLRQSTSRTIIAFAILYLVAFMLSSTDLSGRSSNITCSIITLMVAIGCYYAAFRSFVVALRIERVENWFALCCCKRSALKVMLAYTVGMILLGTLKLWSVTDLFLTEWRYLPFSYHAQAWVYLSSNTVQVILCLIVGRIFEDKAKCALMPKREIKTVI